MAALPCLAMILYAVASMLFGKPTEKNSSSPASEKTTACAIKPFCNVVIEKGNNYNIDVEVNKGPKPVINVPDNWEEYVEYSVDNSTLTINLTSSDIGKGTISLSTPLITSIKGCSNGVKINGFATDSIRITNTDDLTLSNCSLAKLSVGFSSDTDYFSQDICADSTLIDSLFVGFGCNSLDILTPSGGRINVVEWHNTDSRDSYLHSIVKKANIGTFNWTPIEGQSIEFNTTKAASINLDK